MKNTRRCPREFLQARRALSRLAARELHVPSAANRLLFGLFGWRGRQITQVRFETIFIDLRLDNQRSNLYE